MAEKGGGNEPPAYPGSGIPDPAMPTTYNSPPPTYTQPAPSTTVNKSFVLSVEGVALIAESVLSFLLFLCAACDKYFAAWPGGGWVIFVGVVTWIFSVTLFIFHLLNIIEKMPSYLPMPIIEMGYTGTAAVLIFISACVASSKWAWAHAVRACAMFGWFGLIAYGADTVRRFLQWRNENQQGLPTTAAANTTTTSSPSSITTEPHY